jgi:hypothetical protein
MRAAFGFEFRETGPEFFDFVLLLGHFLAVVTERFIHIGTVSHPVQDWLRVRPEPGQWPEQPAEAKREEAQALNRSGLRVHFFVRNLFRQNMDEPESGDANNRRDDEYDPRDAIGDGVERFAMENRSVRASRQCQGRESNQWNEMSAATRAPVIDGLNE